MKIAYRWLSSHHECPYCGEEQEDNGEPGEIYKCINCDKEYELGDC